MSDINVLGHAEDCVDPTDQGECRLEVGGWNQPRGYAVARAVDDLGDDAPWCVIARRAWQITSETDEQ